MDKQTVRYSLIALLGAVGLALAARALPTATRSSQQNGGGSGGGGGFVSGPEEKAPAGSLDGVAQVLTTVLTVLVVVALVLALWHLYHNRQRAFALVVVALVLVGGAVVLSELLPAGSTTKFVEETPIIGERGLSDPESEGSGGSPSSGLPGLLVVGVFIVALLGGLGAAYLARSDSRDGDTDQESEERTAAAVALGEAAGEAADRIQRGTGADNAIYRAWGDMTELLDLTEAETKTPGEFADAAIEAGIRPGDVRELTRLFEQVRYGTATPSEEDETRAVELFRRIESTYTEEGEE